MLERKSGESIGLRLEFFLRVDELEFTSRCLHQRCGRFRAHAQPVDPNGRGNGSIGLNADFK